MTNTRSETMDATPIVVTLVAGWLLTDLAQEKIFTPPNVVMAYAIVASAVLTGWWIWYLRKHQPASPAPAAVAAGALTTTITCGIGLWIAESMVVPHGPTPPDVATSTLSAHLLAVVFLPLASEALLRVYLLPRLRSMMSVRDVVLTCAIAGSVVGGRLEHALSNAMVSAMLTWWVLRTGSLSLAPIVRCGIALIATATALQQQPLHANAILVAVAFLIPGVGAGVAFVRVAAGVPAADATEV